MFGFLKRPVLPDSPTEDGQDGNHGHDELKISTTSLFLDNPRTRNVGEYIKQALEAPTDREKTRCWIPAAIGGCLVILLALISLSKSYNHTPYPGHDCGSSPDEARAKGCVFDPMTFCWVRPECNDPELTKEFFEVQDWKYWRDKNGTEEVSFDEVAQGNAMYWSTFELHLTHCAYCYKKLHRAILGNGFIDSHLGSYNHTSHCAMHAADDGISLGYIIVQAPLHFTTCNPVSYDVDKEEV